MFLKLWPYLTGILLSLLVALIYKESKMPLFTVQDITLAKNPGPVAEINILHLADLHGDAFGKGQKRIQKLIEGINVDLVALAGDLVDEKLQSFEPLKDFLNILPKVPTFFVPGNHDKISPFSGELFKALSDMGIRNLENRRETISVKGHNLDIVGIDDPHLGQPDLSLLLKSKPLGTSASILLSHSPTLGSSLDNESRSILRLASKNQFDLVLTGHTHGGQVKLPILGAIFVPGQSFPPKYVEGIYKEKDTSMFITRGLGTSRLPIRFLSRPEVVLIKIHLS